MSETLIKPTKPWKLTPSEIAYPALLILLSLIADYAVVATTGFKGKLSFSILFFVFATLSIFFYKLRTRGFQAAKDSLASSFMLTAAIIVFIPVASILYSTLSKGIPGLHKTLFTDTMFTASYLDPVSKGGLFHAIVGTLYLIILTVIISVPTGILTALYLTEIKGRAAGFIQFLVQAMSGVPSVVAGVFIYAALLITTNLRGSTFIGALPLAILMIPTVTRTAQEVLNLVPNELREAGLALGATQWRTVMTIVVPAARSGLITAIILGIARIAGETAPLLFTLGTTDKVNWNPFSGGQNALPYYVWSGLRDGTEGGIQRAWSAILVLLILVLSLFTTARIFGDRKAK